MTASTVRFTEEMLGHVTFGETDFARGAVASREGSEFLKFHLTIEVQDMEAFSHDPLRPAVAVGYLQCDALGGRLPVEQGWFNLFVDVGPRTKHMLYRLWFRDGVGHPLTMTGFKLVEDDAGFDVWKDTTTLFTQVLRGHVPEGQDATAEHVASGILRIRVRDFAKQLTTFRAGGPDARSKAGALVKFGWIFLGQLAEAYLRKGRRANGKAEADQG
jgi:cholesterol oxidase